MKSIQDIWKALDLGKIVHWENTAYTITIESILDKNEFQLNHFSCRNNKVLRVTYTSNNFGSLIAPEEVGKCFISNLIEGE